MNAPGNGVADDKGIYYFVPKMIKYYLGEEPILDNAPTYLPYFEEDKNTSLIILKTCNQRCCRSWWLWCNVWTCYDKNSIIRFKNNY